MEKHSKSYIINLALFCTVFALIIISVGEIAIRRDAEHEQSLVHDTLQNSGALIAQDIQRNIAYGIFVTDTLHTLLKSNDYRFDDFENWGRQIVVNGACASTVELAPGGIVSHIYPLEGNEGAIGHDLLKDRLRDQGAVKAIQSRELTFIGPVKLIQNGKYGVIARKPIFRRHQGGEAFWGFTIAVILVEDIFPEKMGLLEQQGLYIKLEGDDPDADSDPVLFISEGWDDTDAVKMEIKVPNGTWTLKLNHPPIENRYYAIFRIIIIFFSLAVSGYIFVQQYRMRSGQQEIINLNEKLTELTFADELTGVGNRRAGMQVLENQLQQSTRYDQPLSVIMIDLDFFKQVNDRYGHPAGDRLLRHLASCLKKAVRKSDLVFRLGGDEFLMIFPQTGLEKCLKAVENMIQYIKIHPCRLKEAVLPITLSIGLVQSRPGESVDALLHRVDIKLYEAKESGRNCIRH